MGREEEVGGREHIRVRGGTVQLQWWTMTHTWLSPLWAVLHLPVHE